MKFAVLFSSTFFFAATLISQGGQSDSTSKPEDLFKITMKRSDDKVEVKNDKDRVVVDVQSPFGISQAVIERKTDKWPDNILVRLHLTGLEHFTVETEKTKLDGSVGVKGGKTTIRLWKDGKEDTPLDAKSPLWLDIHVLASDGNPAQALPVPGGTFELPLPKALFENNPKTLTVKWIDFYR